MIARFSKAHFSMTLYVVHMKLVCFLASFRYHKMQKPCFAPNPQDHHHGSNLITPSPDRQLKNALTYDCRLSHDKNHF